MAHPITQKSADYSSREQFAFSFFCDRCGKEWVSLIKPFSGGICGEVKNDDALRLLWGNEHRAAFDEANLEAHLQFNNCPVCGKWVCDDCFCIEGKSGGMCRGCDSK